MKVFLEVSSQMSKPLHRLHWLNCGYDLVEDCDHRWFAVKNEDNDEVDFSG